MFVDGSSVYGGNGMVDSFLGRGIVVLGEVVVFLPISTARGELEFEFDTKSMEE